MAVLNSKVQLKFQISIFRIEKEITKRMCETVSLI